MSPQAADSRRCGVGALAHLSLGGLRRGLWKRVRCLARPDAEDQDGFDSPQPFGGPNGPRRRWGRKRNEKSSSSTSCSLAAVALTIRLAIWSSSWRSSSGSDTALSTIEATHPLSKTAPK